MEYEKGNTVKFKEESKYEGEAKVIKDGMMVLVEKDDNNIRVPKNEIEKV